MKQFLQFIKCHHISNFNISFPLLYWIVRFFYGMLAIYYYSFYVERVIKNWRTIDLDNHIWLWPVQWMDFIPGKSFVYIGILLGGFLLSIICTMFPHKKWIRILVFLLNFQSLAMRFSPDKIDNSSHAMLIISFWLIFLPLSKKHKSVNGHKIQLYFWAAQVSFLGTYCLSGLWKLREFISSIWSGGISSTDPPCLVNNFAKQYSLFNMSDPFYLSVLDLFSRGYVGHLLWIGVIVFQISCPVAAWFPSLQRFYGVMIILFHFSTALLMNIHFISNMYIALIMLVCHPYQLRFNSVSAPQRRFNV